MFVQILIHCQPLHPEELWDTFKEGLSEDFSRNNDSITAQKRAYAEINNLLIEEGHNIAEFPTMNQEVEYYEECVHDISDQESEQILENGIQQYNQLNEKQKEIVDDVLDKVENQNINNTNCCYIDGPGGSGKTFIYKTLYNILKSKNKNVCNMAFTGIVATLLPKGKTVHKVYGLPVPLLSDSSVNIKNQ